MQRVPQRAGPAAGTSATDLLSAVVCCDTNHSRQDRLPGLGVDDDDLRVLWVLTFRCSHSIDPRGSCGLLAIGNLTTRR